MKKKRPVELPIQEAQCATCPFREGSKTEFLRTTLAMSALSEASRICHSTGSNNAFHKRTGKPQALCRGARDVQLKYLYSIGFIDAPTDEAWMNKCKEMGII
jgi:hypothetical protein